MLTVSLIAAVDRHFAIGKNNELPWHLPDDLKRFKALTLNKPILMGRKTAQSLGRALPKRDNLVLTRSGLVPFEGMQAVDSVNQAINIARDSSEELCVIGGGEIYRLCLPLATRMYLTHVDAEVIDADAYFPEFDLKQWTVLSNEVHQADEKNKFAYTFSDYLRCAE